MNLQFPNPLSATAAAASSPRLQDADITTEFKITYIAELLLDLHDLRKLYMVKWLAQTTRA